MSAYHAYETNLLVDAVLYSVPVLLSSNNILIL